MEDVLTVYARPYDPARPVICLDETRKELHGTPYGTLPASPGQPLRQDYVYTRSGSSQLYMMVEPLQGRRFVHIRPHQTAIDFAQEVAFLVDEAYPEAQKIVLVMDNLKPHTAGALYECFEPERASYLASKIEWHYTPEHGSWLNMAEIELSALTSQCLNRRIADEEQLKEQVQAWNTKRDQQTRKIDWQFQTADARIKLRRLYPKPSPQI